MSISLFMGQLSFLATAAIRRSLSSFSSLHSSSMRSDVHVCVCVERQRLKVLNFIIAVIYCLTQHVEY
jgi:hypothetical protein